MKNEILLEARSPQQRAIDDARKKFLTLSRQANAELTQILQRYSDGIVGAMTTMGALEKGVELVEADVELALRPHSFTFLREVETAIDGYLRFTVQTVVLRDKSILALLASGADAVLKDAMLEAINAELIAAGITEKMFEGVLVGSQFPLSTNLWILTQDAQQQAIRVAQAGLRQGINAIQISKDIETVLVPQPTARDVVWSHGSAPKRLKKLVSSATKGLRTRKNTVSYNYLRIARSEMFRAQRAANILTSIGIQSMFPFKVVLGIRWNLSNAHEIEDVCDEWASDDVDGIGSGIYKPQNVPQGHPNDLCFTTPELIKPREFVRRLNRLDPGDLTPERGIFLFQEVVEQHGDVVLGFGGAVQVVA